MFIDICFPKDNEKKFIEISQALRSNLCFVYNELPKRPMPGFFYGSIKKSKKAHILLTKFPNISKDKRAVYFFIPEKTKSFHYPININHVAFKEISGRLLGFSYLSLLNDPNIEQMKFALRLCKKYKVGVFFASFAHSPAELRGMAELRSLASVLGMDTKQVKDSFNSLHRSLVP